jgi:RimJ/RimL family protein N-acetyltransferase
MSEQTANLANQVPNLHEQPSLQEVQIREGVVLRPMAETDAAELLDVLNADPSIRDRVTVASRMHAEDDVKREVEAYKADEGLIRYVVVDEERVVGLVSFWRDDGFFGQEANPNSYGFGYFLHPKARGRGLITDSVGVLMRVAQESFPVDYFMAFCEDDNPKSIRVLRKLGFEPTERAYVEPTRGWKERLYEKGVNSSDHESEQTS